MKRLLVVAALLLFPLGLMAQTTGVFFHGGEKEDIVMTMSGAYDPYIKCSKETLDERVEEIIKDLKDNDVEPLAENILSEYNKNYSREKRDIEEIKGSKTRIYREEYFAKYGENNSSPREGMNYKRIGDF